MKRTKTPAKQKKKEPTLKQIIKTNHQDHQKHKQNLYLHCSKLHYITPRARNKQH